MKYLKISLEVIIHLKVSLTMMMISLAIMVDLETMDLVTTCICKWDSVKEWEVWEVWEELEEWDRNLRKVVIKCNKIK
jgi:hypothetical protein